MEADVLAVLPVPAGDRSVHAGAVGEDHLQLYARLNHRNGSVYWIYFYATTHPCNFALL